MEKYIFQAKEWLDKCYSNSAPSETTVKIWYADFKRGRTDTRNAEPAGHSNLVVVPRNTKKKKLPKLFLANRRLKLFEIAEEVKISYDSEFTILHENLSARKLFLK